MGLRSPLPYGGASARTTVSAGGHSTHTRLLPPGPWPLAANPYLPKANELLRSGRRSFPFATLRGRMTALKEHAIYEREAPPWIERERLEPARRVDVLLVERVIGAQRQRAHMLSGVQRPA